MAHHIKTFIFLLKICLTRYFVSSFTIKNRGTISLHSGYCGWVGFRAGHNYCFTPLVSYVLPSGTLKGSPQGEDLGPVSEISDLTSCFSHCLARTQVPFLQGRENTECQ